MPKIINHKLEIFKGISHMRKNLFTLFVLSALLFLPNAVMAEVLLDESFDSRSTGDLTSGSVQDNMGTNQTNWWYTTSTASKLQVASGGLTYSGYKSSSSTNAVSFTGNTNKALRAFMNTSGYTVPTSAGSKVYMSFLMNVTSLPSTTPDNFISLGSYSRSDLTASNLYLKVNTLKVDASSFKLGVAKCGDSNSASYMNYSDALNINTTYLIVVEYERVSGDNNDAVKLYINPTKSTPGTPVVTTVDIKSGGGSQMGSSKSADLTKIYSVYLKPSSSTPVMKVDEIRIATTWDDLFEAAPAPSVPAPSPAASSITVSSATISWDAVEDADSYVLQWKKSGSSYSSDIVINKDVRSYSINNLDENTKYYVRVKTIVGENSSAWAEINFDTDPEPETITYKGITFNKHAAIDVMPTSGSYYLAKNASFNSDVTLTGDLDLCLHGKTLSPSSACIIVPSGITLTIYDDQVGGQIYGGYVGTFTHEGMISIEEGGTLIVREGKIESITDGVNYDAFAIHNKGSLVISGNPEIIAEDASIYLGSGNVITLEDSEPLTNTTPYTVDAAGQLFTSGWRACMGDADPSDHFVSAKSGYSQVLSGRNELYLTYEQTILLSEDNDNASAIADAVDNGTTDYLLVDRAFTDAQYNTICLPFALTNTQLEYVFGSGFDLREFSSSSLDGDELSLTFSSRTALEAGKPYLIKPSQPVEDILRNGISVTTKEPVDNTEDANISFHGTFSPTELTGGNRNLLFLGADNELFWPDATGNLKGFRAYFEVKGGAALAAKRARIVKKEDSATGIESQMVNGKCENGKFIKDGQLLILHDNKTYNVIGQMVK